jgi:hypothetical protein
MERVARRDFPEEQIPEVMNVLGEYGSDQPEMYRVRLAALKLAARNLRELRYWIEQAKCDYRDVLGPAEYPLYSKKWGRMDKMPKEEQQEIIRSDWEQYEKWLNG